MVDISSKLRGGCLLGVSGGVDSMAMLHMARKIEKIEVCHVNYKLRSDSDEDQKTVADFCREFDIPLHILIATDIPNSGIEEWARNLRYNFFKETMEMFGIPKLATAHTVNDQAETVLMRMMRGTGIKGLRGIIRESDTIIRPMIDITKKQLYEYCSVNNVPFREDYTNLDTTYTRNMVRHEILKDKDPTNIAGIATLAQKVYPKLLAVSIARLSPFIMRNDSELWISKSAKLDDLDFIYLSELLLPYVVLNSDIMKRIKSSDPDTNVIHISKTLICDKRSPKKYRFKFM